MNDEHIIMEEMRVIAAAIEALRAVAAKHYLHEEHFDGGWASKVDGMIRSLRTRDADCLRLRRHLNGLEVPAASN